MNPVLVAFRLLEPYALCLWQRLPNLRWETLIGHATSLVVDTLDFNIYAVTESSSGVII